MILQKTDNFTNMKKSTQIKIAYYIAIYILLNFIFSSCTAYKDSIKNPDNREFLNEIVFNKQIRIQDVKQSDFNQRYLNKRKSLNYEKLFTNNKQ